MKRIWPFLLLLLFIGLFVPFIISRVRILDKLSIIYGMLKNGTEYRMPVLENAGEIV